MAKSFKRQNDPIPLEYRTPSPPHRYEEAVSPVSSYSLRLARETPPAPEYEQITPDRFNGFEEAFKGFSEFSFSPSYPSNHASYSSKSTSQLRKIKAGSSTTRNSAHARDHRGTRSESLGQLFGHNDTTREEAELLLNFTREARFAVPKTPIMLTSPSQHRSVSFNSYHQTRPSLLDLAASGEFSNIIDGRPATQDGVKSLWGEETHLHMEILRRASHGEQPTDSHPASPMLVSIDQEVEQINHQSIEPDANVNGVSAEHSAVKVDSLGPSEEPLEDEAGENIQTVSISIMAEEAEQTEHHDILPLEPQHANVDSKKNSDMPSICASCNFARNTAANEPDSELTSWISCDGCRSWFHFACAGFKSEREVRSVDKFRCKNCKPVFGPTTYVRKSARAHTSIDYAGLNEGVIKTSDIDPEHHYVKDFKNGKKFTPEYFARMRPEYVTAEFFERGDGMKEPIVIPAAFNPRPLPIPDIDISEDAEDFDEQAEKCDQLHDRELLDSWLVEDLEYDVVQDQGQDALDMVIPKDLTVRKVAELYGPEEKLEVIDVKSQNGEDKPWTLKRWADYYESTGEKVVRNVISLEVSQSRLGRLIRRPKVVRDLDLQDSVWPSELQVRGEYPKVQFYCLMSVADCYTDFHIDFGGSSVYYHILRGKKTFFFIPPTEKHLKQYEEWCNSPAQNWTFLGDQTNQCYRVDLSEGDTMLIPAGWIHAVWTPADSLVIGGNFLTRLHYPLQIRVAQIEKATNVARKFRYPYFQKLLWYSAIRYLDEDPIPESIIESLNTGQVFHRSASTKDDYNAWGENSLDMDENYHVRYYPRMELDGLPELCNYLLRTALIASGYLTDGISIDTRNAVKRSIPKGHNHGEPFEAIKKFACWCTWKRGNETIPYWAYSNYLPECAAAESTDKKLSIKARKKLDHEAANQAIKTAPDRQSNRARTQPQSLLNEIMINQLANQAAKAAGMANLPSDDTLKRKLEDTPSPADRNAKKMRLSNVKRAGSGRKTACDACRKSRRACRHGQNSTSDQSNENSVVIESPTALLATSDQSIAPWNGGGPYDAVPHLSTGGQIKNESREDRMMLDSPQVGEMDNPIVEAGKIQSKPGGRTKACKDCRKSKVSLSMVCAHKCSNLQQRRCVHDELGNEDPRKLAEAAIPRPTAKRKKLLQNEPFYEPIYDSPVPTNINQATTSPPQDEATPYNIGVQIPDIPIDPFLDTPSRRSPVPDRTKQAEPITAVDDFDINQLIDPALFDPSLLAQNGHDPINLAIAQSAEQALSMLHTSPLIESKYDRHLQDIQSPQPVDLSLVSPPNSAMDGQERSVSDNGTPKGFTPPSTNNSSSRHSSQPAAKLGIRFTPDSGTPRQPSLCSGGAVSSSRDSTSPMTNLPPNTTPLKRSKSRSQSELDSDEASLKLIREMQAQDLGLRRRG